MKPHGPLAPAGGRYDVPASCRASYVRAADGPWHVCTADDGERFTTACGAIIEKDAADGTRAGAIYALAGAETIIERVEGWCERCTMAEVSGL